MTPNRKDVCLVAAVLALAAVLWALSRAMPRGPRPDAVATLEPDAVAEVTPAAQPTDEPQPTDAPEPTDEPQPTDAPEPTDAPQAADEASGPIGPMPQPQTERAKGVVYLTVGGRPYGGAIAMDRDKIITIRQADGRVNLVHITPEEVYMESSTCPNQDCVEQGHVAPEDVSTRILGGFIVCLPNEVTVEVVPEA